MYKYLLMNLMFTVASFFIYFHSLQLRVPLAQKPSMRTKSIAREKKKKTMMLLHSNSTKN